MSAISETLLLPLAYRAAESRRPDGLIHDPKAIEIVAQLAYDFSKLDRQRFQQLNVGLRAREFDRAVRAFLTQHPNGVVVDIGCGLDTRFERVDNGQVTWFNLDFPEVMALRERFFAPHPRCHTLACSALEFDWMDEVAQHPGPYFFLAEAVESPAPRHPPDARRTRPLGHQRQPCAAKVGRGPSACRLVLLRAGRTAPGLV